MIINLTPHSVNVEGGPSFPPSGTVIRIEMVPELVTTIHGIKVVQNTLTKATDVPKAQEGVYYIVSRVVKSALPERDDFIVPDGLIRDSEGRVTGCTRFAL